MEPGDGQAGFVAAVGSDLTGWSPGWVNSASVVVTAAGSADSWSGLGNYQWQTSTDGGALWSSLLSGTR